MNSSQARLRVQSSRFARHPDKLKADFARPQEVLVTGRSSQANSCPGALGRRPRYRDSPKPPQTQYMYTCDCTRIVCLVNRTVALALQLHWWASFHLFAFLVRLLLLHSFSFSSMCATLCASTTILGCPTCFFVCSEVSAPGTGACKQVLIRNSQSTELQCIHTFLVKLHRLGQSSSCVGGMERLKAGGLHCDIITNMPARAAMCSEQASPTAGKTHRQGTFSQNFSRGPQGTDGCAPGMGK